MAGPLGKSPELPGLESRRHDPGQPSLRAASSAGRATGGSGVAAAEVLHPRHVPLPERRGAACGTSRRIHRHRHPLPLQARARLQCAAPDGLGCVWPSGRAVRHPHGPASARDHGGERRQLQAPDPVARVQLRLDPRGISGGRSGSSSSFTRAGSTQKPTGRSRSRRSPARPSCRPRNSGGPIATRSAWRLSARRR